MPAEAELAKQAGHDYEPAAALLERILAERRRRWSESGKKGKYQEPTPPDTASLPPLPEGCKLIISALNRAARLRQSVLKWAFEGTLADQHPGDEPVDAVLSQIRAAGGRRYRCRDYLKEVWRRCRLASLQKSK